MGKMEVVPIIINETTFGELGDFNNWFSGSGNWNNAYSSPWYILIDSNFIYTDLFESKSAVSNKINDLLIRRKMMKNIFNDVSCVY